MRYVIETLMERKKNYMGILSTIIIRRDTIKIYDLSPEQTIKLEKFLTKVMLNE